MLYVVALAFVVAVAQASSIEVGAGQGGWTVGLTYPPVQANVGDDLVFNYQAGIHDVWMLPSSACNFTAPGAMALSSPGESVYTYALNQTGTFYFACSSTGHCQAGQLLQVTVTDGGAPASSPTATPAASPGEDMAGEGTCAAPVTNATTGLITVSCRSPAVSLSPGDNIYPNVALPTPYPNDTQVILSTVSAEVVDANGQPVPLSEVYLHHTFGDIRFIPGEGAEVRHSPMRIPLPAPYALIVNGSEFIEKDARFTNLHVINTVGVPADQLKACIECWCPGTNPPIGSIGCCAKCNSTSTDPPKDYYLEFNVTYVPATVEALAAVEPLVGVALDVHGGVEYSIAPMGNDAVAYTNRTYALDYFCPQDGPFGIVRCWAHQHIGAKCITMYDQATGDVICESCPTYGNETGVVGNEAGYVVAMSATVHDPPYVLQPGQQVLMSAAYDASQPYGGVMSLMALQLSNFTASGNSTCQISYDSFVQPPVATSENATQITDDVQSLIDAIPDKCTGVKPYFTDVVEPCLPMALASKAGQSLGMGAMGTCCDAVKKNQNALNSLFGNIAAASGDTSCLCPVGEVLQYAVTTKLLTYVADISNMCTGSKTSADDVQNGVSVALNAFFGPKCPNLQQELNSGAALPPLGDAMGSTATSTSQNADSSTGSSSSSNTSPSAAASAPAPASSGALKVSVALAALTALFPAVFM